MDELSELLKQVRLYAGRGAPAEMLDRFVAEKTNGMVGTVKDLEQAVAKTSVSPKNLARAAGMGATFGFLDELAGMGAAEAKAPFKTKLASAAVNALLPGAGLGVAAGLDRPTYEAERDRVRGDYGMFREAHPRIDLAAEIAGGLLVPGAAAAKTTRAGLRTALARGALTGAGAGAASGLGYSEAEDPAMLGIDAASGGALGALFGGAAGGAAAGVRSLRGSLAQRRLQRALNEAGGASGVRTADAAARAAGRGDVVMAADLHPRLRAEADFATQNNPAVFGAAQEALEQRAAGSPQRVLNDMDEILGGLPDAAGRRATLDAERQRIGDFYDVLAKTAPNLKGNARLEGVIEQLRRRGLLQGRAVRIAEEALETGEYKSYNELRKLLRGQKDAIYQNPSPLAVKDDGNTLGRMADELDRVLSEEVPGFAEQQAKYAASVAPMRALDEGLQAVKSENVRELRRTIASMTPANLEQFRYGVASGLVDELTAVATNRNAATRYINASADLESKLRLVFGTEERFQQFMMRAKQEREMGRTMSVVGGSQTQRRGANAALDPLEVVAGGSGGLRSRVMGGLRNMAFGERNAKAAAEIGPALLQPGGGIDALLQLLEEMNRKRTLSGMASVTIPATAGLLSGR